jgi:recombination protein RecR
MATPLDRLIHALAKLPGVGHKSATRLAFHLVRAPRNDVDELAAAVRGIKEGLQFCEECLVPSQTPRCAICDDLRRDRHQICVVEEPADLHAIEKSGAYHGLYHILHGALSPLDGIGPDALKVQELLARLQNSAVHEVILATNATVEGEATASYVANMLRVFEMSVTRLAGGLPVGAEVEYVDARTLALALEERRAL